MLTILEGLEVDLKAWKRAEEDGGVAKLPGQSNASPMSLHIDSRVSGSPSSSSMHGPPREATSKLGYEWQVLFDVLPKVQATSSRCEYGHHYEYAHDSYPHPLRALRHASCAHISRILPA